ncbi:MAG: glycoside hydrolase family 9 protein [Armatimonadetes bacterium]|nr:glycoside hydrolase family 9 protein [Armatimonadota bacterium]
MSAAYGMLLYAVFLQSPQDSFDPHITVVSLAEPTVLSVEIRGGGVITPPLEKNPDFKPGYLPPADHIWRKNGEDAGAIVGKKGEFIQPAERAIGRKWDPAHADEPREISLRIAGKPIVPETIARKSFPGNLGRIGSWKFDGEAVHRLYLRLPNRADVGVVELSIPGAGSWRGTLDPRKTRTEGLRVNQVGYRADDPDKSALFTLWMGSVGGSSYVPTRFEVVDALTSKAAFAGTATLFHDGSKQDSLHGDYGAKAPVYVLDFSPLKTPGKYRVVLPGVGYSYDFEISPSVWERAFAIAAKGFYFQRNGIAHGKPYSWYTAPRAFHPDSGTAVHASTCSLMDSGNGLNALGTDKDNFGNLVKGATNRTVANAWGGYKDAGDWDSRIQHLEASRMLLELAELFPGPIRKLKLNIPESKGKIPDLIAEAMWNVDHYKRMQTPEGGIRGGVEFEEHPNYGEVSWTTRLRLFAYAPDPWCSWLYAATATRLSRVLQAIDATRSAEYLASAKKAYDWGVSELARLNRQKLPPDVLDAKVFAATELYATTKEDRYAQDLSRHLNLANEGSLMGAQGEAAALIARTGLPFSLAQQAKRAILDRADLVIKQTQTNSLRQGHAGDWAYPGYGRDVSPLGGKFLIWAHEVTGDSKYLAALLRSNGFLVGMNPTNTVFTSGVGSNPVKRPFMLDPRYSGGGRMPEGITVYGPLYYNVEKEGPWFTLARPFMYPDGSQWPQAETWFDSFWTIMMNEFTVMQSLGPTSHVWGYLAFRK